MTFASYGNNAMYPALGLSEEAGEVAGKIAKFIRKNDGIDPKKAIAEFPNAMADAISQFRNDLEKELGDVLWMVAATASEYGLSLENIAKMNIDTVDIGVAVVSMHAPYEVISKADVYEMYLACRAFMK